MNPHKKLFIIAGGIAVIIVGVIYFDNTRQAQAPTEQNNVMATDISDWKTYRNEEYGFELKYPEVEVAVPITVGINPHGPRIAFAANTFGVVIDENYHGSLTDFRYENVSPQGTTIGGFQIYSLANSSVPFIAFATVSQGKVYIIEFQGNAKLDARTERILSTFKFIEPSASGAGTLSGKVSIGPICPVEQIDNPCPTPPEAYTARAFMVFLGDTSDLTKVAAIIHADSSGNYSVSLAPGIYTVRPAIVGIGYMSKDLPATVTIKSGSTVILNIDVDTGIR